MALVKTTKAIVTIRGRCGGNYFKHSPDGQHIQAMPRHVKFAHSEARMFGVKGMSFASPIWMLALIAGYAIAWAGFAAYHYFTSETSGPHRISGYNWYIHYAMIFPETERPPMWRPPAGPYQLPNFIATGYRDLEMYYITQEQWPAWWPFDYFTDRGQTHLGDIVYETDNGIWFLWWNGERWIVSRGAGNVEIGWTWFGTTFEINGQYHNPGRNHDLDIWPGHLSFYDHI